MLHFSHSVRMDVSAHLSAPDDEEFFVVEGSGWRGRRESAQVICHFNSVHALAFIDKHGRRTSPVRTTTTTTRARTVKVAHSSGVT